jgi:hypothetical protein
MRVDTRPRRRNSMKADATKRCPSHIQWLRGRPCAVASFNSCMGPVQAAHVDHGGDKGVGTKASDRFAIPLCFGHHNEQHAHGWETFEAKYRFDALRAADAYWLASPHRAKFEARS